MGASNSHDYEYEKTDQNTPPKIEKASRILTIDPRSPTQDIERTPIVVEKTPENTLEGPLDPRSPTVGIVRTPLSHIQPLKTEEPEPVAIPKIDLDQDISSTEEASTEETQDPLLHPLSMTDVQNLSLDDLPISESTRLMPQDNELMASAETEKVKKKKKPRATQPKELFPAKKASALKDTTRSPLSSRNIDMNSPLQIVQRKQMKDIDLKRTCSQQESAVSRFIVKDKENL